MNENHEILDAKIMIRNLADYVNMCSLESVMLMLVDVCMENRRRLWEEIINNNKQLSEKNKQDLLYWRECEKMLYTLYRKLPHLKGRLFYRYDEQNRNEIMGEEE